MPQADRTEVRIWEFWPTDMAQMFARAGMPKPEPPPFAPECGRENMITGEAPRIVLPKDGLTYKLSLSSPGHENMVFMAHADAGVKTLHWFVNGRYLGKGVPGEVFPKHSFNNIALFIQKFVILSKVSAVAHGWDNCLCAHRGHLFDYITRIISFVGQYGRGCHAFK